MLKFLQRGILAASFCALSSSVLAEEIVCDRPISEKICYVNSDWERKCGKEPEELADLSLADQFTHIFDVAPPVLKLAMCELDKIKIAAHYDIPAGAYYAANSIHFSWETIRSFQRTMHGRMAGGFWTYRFTAKRDENDTTKTIRDYAKITDRYALRFELDYQQPHDPKLNYPLANVFYHELAHLIDHRAAFNDLPGIRFFDCFTADQRKNSDWFVSQETPIKGYVAKFPDMLKKGHDSNLIKALYEAPYATFYGLTNEGEDFAEILSEYVMLEHFGVNYSIKRGGEMLFSRSSQFDHENIQPKLNIVKTVMALHKMTTAEREAFKQERLLCKGDFASVAN